MITAIASIIFPFTALGSEHLLVKNVSIDRSTFSTNWGNSLILITVISTLVTIILLLLSPLLFPRDVQWGAILLILLSDLICLALLDLGSKSLLATNMINKSAQLGILSTCSKLLAALSLAVFFTNPSVATWGYLYFISSAIMATVTIILVNKMLGFPRPVLSELKSNITEGFSK